jgi:hypothetical protein
MLAAEDTNLRARALYEHLGYAVCGHTQDSWKETDPLGHIPTYHADVTLMRKCLT